MALWSIDVNNRLKQSDLLTVENCRTLYNNIYIYDLMTVQSLGTLLPDCHYNILWFDLAPLQWPTRIFQITFLL